MKKIIGYIVSHFCFSLGHLVCKVSHWKINGEFVFDKGKIRYRIGYWLAGEYQRWMHNSYLVQKWAGNKTPWRPVKKSPGTTSRITYVE